MNEILDVIHNAIYQFFDVCGDDEETPMSDKDKLLLEVNKAICNNIKALEQEPILDKINISWEEIDEDEIKKSVILLDLFTKTFCRYRNDFERFDDLKFRCDECPFSKENVECLCRIFKNKYAPNYKDFGSMGDLR